jgi:transcriptional regulator with XRE-family HTH domain
MELARRGLSQTAFAEAAGIESESLSRLIHGRGVQARTLRAVIEALERIPPLDGVDQLIAGVAS